MWTPKIEPQAFLLRTIPSDLIIETSGRRNINCMSTWLLQLWAAKILSDPGYSVGRRVFAFIIDLCGGSGGDGVMSPISSVFVCPWLAPDGRHDFLWISRCRFCHEDVSPCQSFYSGILRIVFLLEVFIQRFQDVIFFLSCTILWQLRMKSGSVYLCLFMRHCHCCRVRCYYLCLCLESIVVGLDLGLVVCFVR